MKSRKSCQRELFRNKTASKVAFNLVALMYESDKADAHQIKAIEDQIITDPDATKCLVEKFNEDKLPGFNKLFAKARRKLSSRSSNSSR